MCLCARVTGDDNLESEFALTCGTCEFGLIPDDIGEDKDEGRTCIVTITIYSGGLK